MKSLAICFRTGLLLGSLLFTGSCNKECDASFNTRLDKEHNTQEFDFDNDGISDIRRCYISVVTGESSFIYEGFCGPDEWLYKKESVYKRLLKKGDVLRMNPREEEEFWFEDGWMLWNSSCNGLYKESWGVDSGATAPYYLGVYKRDTLNPLVGWLELDYDLERGDIKVLRSSFTRDSTIAIE